jgi:hypothetical protein
MASFTMFAIFFFSTLILFCILFLTFLIFGRLIKLQFKRWFLAGKGYVEVEHISSTKVRNYFIMKPTNNKFNLDDGFYHYISECVTRKGDIMKKIDKSFLSKMPEFEESEFEGLSDKERKEYKERALNEWKEIQNLYKVISNIKYDPEHLSRKIGMPVITYYGDNPDPLNFASREKAYGSGVIKDMYLRLLLTQRYKDFQFMIMVLFVSWVVMVIVIFGLWRVHLTDATNYVNCIRLVNETNTRYDLLVNSTLERLAQSSVQVLQ